MNVYDALLKMRELSANNIPFSIEFVSCNLTKQSSSGLKFVDKCLLRTGLSKEHSDKHNTLVGYVDLRDNSNKWFYLPLLKTFNNIELE